MPNIIKKRPGDIEGKGEVNIEEVKKLADLRYKIFTDLNNARKTHSKKALRDAIKKSIPEVTHLLRELGIHVTTDIIEKAFNQDIKALEGASRNEVTLKTTLVSSLLSQINNILNTITEQHNRNNTEYNPFLKTDNSKGNVYSNYKDIATKLSDFIESSIESSSYENGKLYYSFNTPSYIKGVVTSLSNALGNDQKFEEYLQKNYGDYKWFKNADGTWNNVWLNMLANEESKRANFEHKVQLSFETRKGRKTPYEDLSEVGYTMSLLNEYFYDTHKNWAWYRVPILSDKPSSEFIKFVRYSKDYQRYISEGMMDVFNQEVMRMKTVLERAVEIHSGQNAIGAINNFDAHKVLEKYPELVEKIKNKTLALNDILKNGKNIFAGTGVEFKFLDMFNEDLLTEDSIVSKVIFSRLNASEQSNEESKQQRDNDEVLLLNAFPKLLKNHMDALFEREVKNWENMGLFEEEIVEVYKNGKKEEVTRYKHLQHLGKNTEEILDNLEEYVWNDMFATINIIQLTVTDLAYYKNVEDFQKRYAQVHSPAMKLNIHARDYSNNLYSKDGIERTIYLKDSFVVSSIIPQVKAVFDKKVKDKEMTQFQADTILAKYGYSNYEDESGKYVKSVIKDGKKDKTVLIPSEEINIADG